MQPHNRGIWVLFLGLLIFILGTLANYLGDKKISTKERAHPNSVNILFDEASINGSSRIGKQHNGSLPQNTPLFTQSKDSSSGLTNRTSVAEQENMIGSFNAVSTLNSAVAAAQEQALIFSSSLASSEMGRTIGQLQAAAQTSMGYLAVEGCTPKDSAELRYIIDSTTCSRVTLVPATNYSLTQQLVIRRQITLVGRPLGLPVIDAHNTTRAFLVTAGGFLDVRFVQIVKGSFVEKIPRVLYQLKGPTCYVRQGGTALFTGCRFSSNWVDAVRSFGLSPPQTTLQVFGGGILVEEGTLRVTDCQRVTFGIGIAFRELQFIGGEILVLSGSVYLTGCIFVTHLIFANNLGAGGTIANLGGTVIVTGCLFNYVGAFLSTSGLGFRCFLGGGTTIITGSIFTSSVCLTSFFGGGGDVFVGSGVAVLTGLVFAGQGIMGIGLGVGLHAALGSGISIRTGFLMSSMFALAFLAGCGMSNYVGTGVTVFSDVSLARSIALYNFYGCGTRLYLGAGTATILNVVGFFNTGIGSLAYIGGDTAILAGYLVRINQLYTSVSAIDFGVGQGADLFLGLGGATLVLHLYIAPPPLIYYKNPGLVTLYVAGNNAFVSTRLGNFTTLFGVLTVNKHGQTEWQKNIFVARMISWRFTDLGPFPGDFADRRKLVMPDNSTLNGHITPSEEAKELTFKQMTKDNEVLTRPSTPHYHDMCHFGMDTRVDLKPVLLSLLDKYLPTDGGDNREREDMKKERHYGAVAKLRRRNRDEIMEHQEKASASNGYRKGVANTAVLRNMEHKRSIDSPVYEFAEIQKLNMGPTKTDKIYVASQMDVCHVCNVTPGYTFENVDGPGALSNCEIQNACSQDNTTYSGWPIGSGSEEQGVKHAGTQDRHSGMWMSRRKEKPANTTVQMIELRSTFTPALSTAPSQSGNPPASVDKEEVYTALQEAITTLHLPKRYHLRVEGSSGIGRSLNTSLHWSDSGDTSEIYEHVPFDYGSIDPTEKLSQQPCQEKKVFIAYFVSDWMNVTDEISRTLKTTMGTRSLTLALQREVDKSTTVDAAAVVSSTSSSSHQAPSPQICSLSAYRATSIHVPSTTLTGLGIDTETVMNTAPVVRRTKASTTGFHRSMKDMREEQKEAEVEENDDQIQALLSRDASASLTKYVSPNTKPWALLRQLPPRVDAVGMNGTYSLVLSNFPGVLKGAKLTVRAVPEKGDEIWIATFPSAPHMLTRQQIWNWTPEKSFAYRKLVRGTEYYLEVTSSDGMAFDATNKFVII